MPLLGGSSFTHLNLALDNKKQDTNANTAGWVKSKEAGHYWTTSLSPQGWNMELVCKDSSQKEILDPVKVGKTAKPQEIGLKT